jgi:hypothetical protein
LLGGRQNPTRKLFFTRVISGACSLGSTATPKHAATATEKHEDRDCAADQQYCSATHFPAEQHREKTEQHAQAAATAAHSAAATAPVVTGIFAGIKIVEAHGGSPCWQ